MKKVVSIIAIVAVLGAIGFFAGSKLIKSTNKNAGNKTVQTEEKAVDSKNVDNSKSGNYAADLEERMKEYNEKEEAGFSGSTDEMANAALEIENVWDQEMNKFYNLLMTKLPENEKEKLRISQEDWGKKMEEEVKEAEKEADGGSVAILLEIGTRLDLKKERTRELAKKYDEQNK